MHQLFKIEVKSDGTTNKFLESLLSRKYLDGLESIAAEGVAALASATPKRSGKTAASWSYSVKKTRTGAAIEWTNSNVNNGVPIAVILQYGHGTGTGGYVAGYDYINPAMKSIFDKLAEKAWKVVKDS